MRNTSSYLVVTMALFAAAFIWLACLTPSEAKPKKIDFGCTMEQTIRWSLTKGGKACMKSLDEAMLSGSNTLFNIFCGWTTAACCQVNTTTGEVSRCQVISATQQQPGVTGQGSNAGAIDDSGGAGTITGGFGTRLQKGGTAAPSP